MAVWDFLRAPDDSANTGKKVDNATLDHGAGSVYRQVVAQGDPTTADAVAAVANADPAANAYGGVVRDPRLVPAASSTVATVGVSATVVTILAANAARKSAVIFNHSQLRALMLKEGATATADDFSHYLPPMASREILGYSGVLTGLWDGADAAGKARVTERA